MEITSVFLGELLKFAPGKGGDELTLGSFTGYGAMYNNRDEQGDMILPGAFKGAIGKTIPMMLNHFDGTIGKITPTGEDEKGLLVEGELTAGVQKALETYALMKHGAVSGLSIRGGLKPADVAYDEATNTRTIKRIDPLREISVCTFPANSKARIKAIKSLDGAADWEALKDVEAWLREAGHPPEEARMFVSKARAAFAREVRRAMDEEAKIAAAVKSLRSTTAAVTR